MRKFQNESTQIFNEKKFFVMKWKKQEARENTISFSFVSKKKETAKTEIVQKNVLLGMTGRYVKGENKGQKKDSQIKENLQKRDTFKKRTIVTISPGSGTVTRSRSRSSMTEMRRNRSRRHVAKRECNWKGERRGRE